MKILGFSLKQILFFSACILLLLFFLYIILYYLFYKPVPKPQLGNFSANYSNFNKLTPGKSTKQDVVSLNGAYESEKIVENKTYLFYKTPSDTIKNVAVLENNKLIYATEEVFSTYRGTPQDFEKKYGKPEAVMYDKVDELITWSVYPSKGIAIATNSFQNVVTKITYFVPQTKMDFLNSLANELNLVENPEVLPTEPLETVN